MASDTGRDVARRLGVGVGQVLFSGEPVDPDRSISDQGVQDMAELCIVDIVVAAPPKPKNKPQNKSPEPQLVVLQPRKPCPPCPPWHSRVSRRCRAAWMVVGCLAIAVTVMTLSIYGLGAAWCDVPTCPAAPNATLYCCTETVFATTCTDHSWVFGIDSCATQWARVDDSCKWTCSYHNGTVAVTRESTTSRQMYDGLAGQKGWSTAGVAVGAISTLAALVCCITVLWRVILIRGDLSACELLFGRVD